VRVEVELFGLVDRRCATAEQYLHDRIHARTLTRTLESRPQVRLHPRAQSLRVARALLGGACDSLPRARRSLRAGSGLLRHVCG
jgi:hypothetical protein